MSSKDETYRAVRRQFGAAASNYVTSKSHAEGADLDLLLELAGNCEGKKVLDIAAGGGHTAIGFVARVQG